MALIIPDVARWSRPLESGGEPPDNDRMEHRLTVLETRLDAVLPTLATKGDVSEAKSSIVMWLSGIVFAGTAITITVLIFAINRMGSPAPTQAQSAPVQSPASQSVPIPAAPAR